MEYVREAIKVFKKWWRKNRMKKGTKKFLGCLILLFLAFVLLGGCQSKGLTVEEIINTPVNDMVPCVWMGDMCHCRKNANKRVLTTKHTDMSELFAYCSRA